MSSKFSLWFKATKTQSQHTATATKADIARTNLVGKGTLVEKHLRRIAKRERLLSQFSAMIANSPALDVSDSTEQL